MNHTVAEWCVKRTETIIGKELNVAPFPHERYFKFLFNCLKTHVSVETESMRSDPLTNLDTRSR